MVYNLAGSPWQAASTGTINTFFLLEKARGVGYLTDAPVCKVLAVL